MHIAYLIPTIDRIGGAERQLIQFATGMAHRGWRVTVIALSGSGGHSAQELSADNVSFLSLDMRHGLADPRGWNRLRCWITSAGPDILHSHLPHASLMARAIRLIVPVRVLIDTIHSPATGSIARQIGYRLTRGLPNVVTGVSRSALNPWLDSGMVDHSKSTVVPNGIDATIGNATPSSASHPTRTRATTSAGSPSADSIPLKTMPLSSALSPCCLTTLLLRSPDRDHRNLRSVDSRRASTSRTASRSWDFKPMFAD
jgi:hypothetical protein